MTTVFNWGYWIDSELPSPGAVGMNNVEWINEEIDAGIDISYLGALAYFIEERIAEFEEAHNVIFDRGNADHAELVEEWTDEFGDLYVEWGGDNEYLIGDWVEDENGKYAPDTNGEYAAIALCGSNIVIVEWSKYATRCALCSPCYPNSGDLDNAGDFLTYDLPLSLYGEFRQNANAQITIAPDASMEAQ